MPFGQNGFLPRFLCASLAVRVLGLLAPFVAAAQTNELEKTTAPLPTAYQDADESVTNGLGSWIWASRTFDMQTVQFWREFEIPASTSVTHARLRMTVDNEYFLYLDGREMGQGAEWHELYDYNVTYLLPPGKHVLAVRAYNASKFAGMIFGLQIAMADGRTLEIKSDDTWRVVPDSEKGWETKTKDPGNWPAATVIGPLGCSPWWKCPDRANSMLTLQPIEPFFWQTGWFQVLSLSVCVVAVIVSLRLVGQVAMHRKERWLLQKERSRIARDMHDDLGSRMTQLVLHGEVAQSELPADSPARLHLDGICQEAREVLFTMDEILWGLNPKRDTFGDFASYICGYAQGFLKSTPIQCLFDVAPEMSSVVLDLPLRRALLMAVKESLNNVVKYSEATEVVLRVACQRQKLVVVVSDNGRGFDRTKINPERNGLANMVERLKEIGGKCMVTSSPGHGCRTELSVSLNQPLRWRSWEWVWGPKRNPKQINRANPLEIHYN